MYFKIENKESQLYKDVMSYIDKKRKTKEFIFSEVNRYFGKNYQSFLMTDGGFNRLPHVHGVVDDGTHIEGMKKSKVEGCLEPNLRTKKGKEIKEFLDNLPNWGYFKELELLPCNKHSNSRRFSLPYIEEFKGAIVAFIDESFDPKETKDFIEITKSEFNRITSSK